MSKKLPPELMTASEVANALRCTTAYVHMLAKAGRLRKLQPSKKLVRFRVGDVARFLNSKMETAR
jgi:excisionase family DNA binding protein